MAMTTMDDKNIDINNFGVFLRGLPSLTKERVCPSEMRTVQLRSLPCSTANEGQSRTLQLLQCDPSVLPLCRGGCLWSLLRTALLLSLTPLNFEAKWLTTPSNARLRSLNAGQTGRSKHPSCMVMDHIGRKSFAASGMGRMEVVAVELAAQHACCERCFKGTKSVGMLGGWVVGQEVELHIIGIVVLTKSTGSSIITCSCDWVHGLLLWSGR